ncbi:hypothetical protein HYH03_010465 [Edaphochlamys debaryana]|uniref:Protein kinase domain-containing protein n=1 Tax=Edaphochlamys debaryana TaxID=47281 RepID=A0A836BXK0_9CHLO|nr:hypothetical protein HYH03_010465 [Edaphochlamys debaryana]|eukprot:KAG2491259.1 hypothetical protein HYH03_010465 [Edaphochlamys debaryana]
MNVTDADFEGYATPLELRGAVTLRGASYPWPVLSMPAQRKVVLANGAVLRIQQVVLYSPQSNFPARSPSLSILAPMPANHTSTVIIGPQAAVLLAGCFPPSVQLYNYNNTARSPPDGKPQSLTIPYPWTNCTNSTSVPWISRCYPLVSLIHDITIAGALGVNGTVQATHTDWALEETFYLCRAAVTLECINKDGPLVCMQAAIHAADAPASAGTPGSLPAGSSSPVPAPPPSLLQSALPEGAEGGGLDSGERSAVIAGTVVGGVLLLSCAVLAAWWVARRGRRPSSPCPGDGGDEAGKKVSCDAPSSTAASGTQGTGGGTSGAPTSEAPAGAAPSFPHATAVSGGPPGPGGHAPITWHTPPNPALDLGVVVVDPAGAPAGPAGASLGPGSSAAGNDVAVPADTAAAPLADGAGASADPATEAGAAAGEGEGAEANKLTLTGVCRGKGACGRVVEGVYRGQRVAVKLLDQGLLGLALGRGGGEPAGVGKGGAGQGPAAAGPAPGPLKAEPRLSTGGGGEGEGEALPLPPALSPFATAKTAGAEAGAAKGAGANGATVNAAAVDAGAVDAGAAKGAAGVQGATEEGSRAGAASDGGSRPGTPVQQGSREAGPRKASAPQVEPGPGLTGAAGASTVASSEAGASTSGAVPPLTPALRRLELQGAAGAGTAADAIGVGPSPLRVAPGPKQLSPTGSPFNACTPVAPLKLLRSPQQGGGAATGFTASTDPSDGGFGLRLQLNASDLFRAEDLQRGLDSDRDGGLPQAQQMRLEVLLAREVELLARINHPNCVRLLAANLGPPQPCLVMELMDTSLDRLLYGSGTAPAVLPLAKVLHIGIQIAQALAYLHPTIIHRDLKPANVLVSHADSDEPVVKLTDFGLSRLQETVLVTSNVAVGTAPYMAPECLNAFNMVVSHHSDMYSFAILMYEMLAAVRPWQGANIVQIACAVNEQRKRPPIQCLARDRCSRPLRALIEACWDHVPERRPGACEVAKELMVIRQKILHQSRGPRSSDSGSVEML